jgi:ligand-binding SRPBCC domain-containing protein
MQTYHLRCELIAACPLLETFQIFENPLNLAKITPPWLNFEVLTKHPVVRAGAEMEYSIRWPALPIIGMPLHWKTLIVEYEAPRYFVDEQAKGPYALWRHRHSFESTTSEAIFAGTRVRDHVEYALPLGKLGELAHALVVKKQLESIFRFRQREVGALLGASTVEVMAPVITAGN